MDAVEFRPITEDATRLLAFEGGEIDLYHGQVVPAEVARLEETEGFTVQRAVGLGHAYVGFNFRNEALDDVRVRQAISHLIPREAIVERILQGIGSVGTGPIAPGVPWYNPEILSYPYDPERARALLTEAGYEGGLSLRLHTNENPVRVQIAEVLQFEAAQVGVTIEVSVEEVGAFIDRIMDAETADLDLFLLGWTGNVDPNYAMFELFHTDGDNNYIAYSNPELDALLEEGRRLEPDSEESSAAYREAQAVLLADPPFAFIYDTEEIGVNQDYITGWRLYPYTSATFQDLHLVEKNR